MNYATLEEVMCAVCMASGVTESDLLGSGHTEDVSAARAVFVGLARRHTVCSYPEIARRLRRRYHSSAANSYALFRRAVDRRDPLRRLDQLIRWIMSELGPEWTSGEFGGPSASGVSEAATDDEAISRESDHGLHTFAAVSDIGVGCEPDGSLAVRTLDECASIMGVTRARAHQLERSAFRKMKSALRDLVEDAA